MDKKIKEIYSTSDTVLLILQKDIAEIKAALLGNEYNPQGGALYRLTDLECRHAKLKANYDKIIWTAAGAGMGASLIISIIVWILEKVV